MTTTPAHGQTTRARAVEAYGNLPLSFEANQGQADPQIKFLSRGGGYGLFLSETEATFYLSQPSGGRALDDSLDSREAVSDQTSPTPASVVRMKFLGSNPTPRLKGRDELDGRSNYFIGNDPEGWRTDIPTYAGVEYSNVYPGVDVVYRGDRRRLEYDFVVAPGTNPGVIKLAFKGVKNTRVDASGDLVLQTAGGEIRQRKPVIYQEAGGVKQYVEGRYLLKGRNEVGFEVGKYDAGRPLVIDPILVYSSYLGGGGNDFGYAIALDDFGNVYVTGETTSADLPTKNPFQSQVKGNPNAFVTKINAAGSAVLYSTYLGGSIGDRARAIAVDQSGSALITGTTSSNDFPTQNPIQPALTQSFNGGVDAFITKLNPAGSGLVFSTYLGGSGFDDGFGIAVDSSENVYVTGSAMDGLPTTVQSFQPSFHCCHTDAFITKLDPAGTQILYSTYLGGRDAEQALGIAVDASQNAYITGYTESSFDFPARNALQPTFGGGVSDAFVAKIPTVTAPFTLPLDSFDNENGGVPALSYSNFSNWSVNAGGVDLVRNPFTNNGLVVNLDGHPPQGATIETKSTLALSPATYRLRFDLAIRGAADSVTVRLGNVFSETFTFASLGTSGLFASLVRDIQVPAQTSAKLSFEFSGGQGSGAYLDNISLFERAGQEYVTFLGGGGDDSRLDKGTFNSGIKVDSAGSAYVTGWTNSPDFPKANAMQPALAGGTDAFVTKLNSSGSALVYSTYLGGSADDLGNDLALDADGNVFVVGSTKSANFPVRNAIQPAFGGETQFYGDGFITKLNAAGSVMVYSTFLGGRGGDVAEGVAVDPAGNAFVAGFTGSADFPVTNSLQPRRGSFDAFFLKIPSVTGTGEPDIFGVTPPAGGNGGSVTVRISGDNFEAPPISVKLLGGGFPELSGARLNVENASALVATFNLQGAPPGTRDVEVVFSANRVRRLDGAFTVVAGGAPRVWVDFAGRDAIRVGQRQAYNVTYGNRGNLDAGALLLFVSGTNGAQFAFPGSERFQDSPVRLFAVGAQGSAGRLIPGSTYSQQIIVRLPQGVTQTTISVGVVDTSGQTFDWGRLASQGVPLGASATDWAARVALARSRIGESWDDLTATLRQFADLAGQQTEVLADFDSVLRYVVTAYGSASDEFGGSALIAEHPAQLGRVAQAQDGTVVEVRKVANPRQIFIITHGYGGSTRSDDRFHMLADELAKRGDVSVYRIEWNDASQRKLFIPGFTGPIPIPLPPLSAPAINPTAQVALEQLAAKGIDAATAREKVTFVGESFGNYVNYRIAELLGGANAALVCNPASELGLYPVPDFRKVFTHSYAFQTYSVWDTNRHLAEHNLFVENSDGLTATQLHNSAMLRLLQTVLAGDTSWLFLEKVLPTLPAGLFDGTWDMKGNFKPSSLATRLDPLHADLAPVPREVRRIEIRVVQSFDPNIKLGPLGVGGQRYFSALEPLRYFIRFENLSTASAPAQDVVITDQLDAAQVDLNTLALGPLTFGDKQIAPPPGLSQFDASVDLRPGNNLIVKVAARLDRATGLLTWRFTSIAPSTGRPPDDPFAGFLPPNRNPPEGEGSLFFTIRPRQSLPTGTEVRNDASVVFDNNPAIQTPAWLNTLDSTAPTSRVQALPPTQSSASFNVQWSGTDAGSGLKDFTIYVSENGGPFTAWLTETTATAAIFYGRASTTYAFRSIAQDLAGNLEAEKSSADATTVTPSGSPIDESRWFVRQHYLDFLGREPDAAGLQFWTDGIEQCGADAQCREVKRINTSAAFFLSIEFQETGYLVYRMYKVAYGDAASPNVAGTVPVIRLQEFLPDTRRIGRGVVVNVGDWQQQLEANKQAFALEFVQRQRFTSAFPPSLTPAQFVDALDRNAGAVLSQAQRDQLIAQLSATPDTSAGRASVLRQVAESQTLRNSEFNRAFVLMQYYGYLRRNPDDPQDADFRGWKFWLDKLDSFGGNFINAEMVKAFISSAEYRRRFGP